MEKGRGTTTLARRRNFRERAKERRSPRNAKASRSGAKGKGKGHSSGLRRGLGTRKSQRRKKCCHNWKGNEKEGSLRMWGERKEVLGKGDKGRKTQNSGFVVTPAAITSRITRRGTPLARATWENYLI